MARLTDKYGNHIGNIDESSGRITDEYGNHTGNYDVRTGRITDQYGNHIGNYDIRTGRITDQYGNHNGNHDIRTGRTTDQYGNHTGNSDLGSGGGTIEPDGCLGKLLSGLFVIVFWVAVIAIAMNRCDKQSDLQNQIQNYENQEQSSFQDTTNTEPSMDYDDYEQADSQDTFDTAPSTDYENEEPQNNEPEPVDLTETLSAMGELSFSDQINRYKFTPKESGRYKLILQDVAEDFSPRFNLYSSDGDKIQPHFQYVYENGGGVYDDLIEGEEYTLEIIQFVGFSTYQLQIYPQTEALDLTNTFSATNRFDFSHQMHKYIFTAPADGTYTFCVDIPDRSDYARIGLYNEAGEVGFISFYSIENAILCEAVAGETFELIVWQGGYLGEYTVSIEQE